MDTPLHWAVHEGDLDEVQRLVQTPGIEVDAVDIDGTPLCYAVERNQLDIARVLINAGADVNLRVDDLPTPLQAAALDGHKEMVMLLLQAGADINSSTSTSWSPLAKACMNGHREVVRILIERGADVNRSPSLYFVVRDDDVDLLQALLDAGANPDGQDNDGNYPHDSPLHYAAMCGRRKCVQMLLAANADPNLESFNGHITLASTCYTLKAAPGIISDLLSYGANVMYKNKDGRTALQELQNYAENYPEETDQFRPEYYQATSILVAAGDRNWDCVPVPCPGIERALLPVWRAAPEELPEVVKRLEEDVKGTLQATLYVINNRLPVDLRMKVLGEVLSE